MSTFEKKKNWIFTVSGQIDDVINSGHFRQPDHDGNHVSNDNLKSNPDDSNAHTGGGAAPRVR